MSSPAAPEPSAGAAPGAGGHSPVRTAPPEPPAPPEPAALESLEPSRQPRAVSADLLEPRARGRLFTWPLLAGLLVTAALVVSSLFIGVYDVFGAEDGAEMFALTRVPRTIALVLAGAAMSMCGLVMQQLTQNRFVEPTTTGTTEWAGLGLLLVMIAAPEAPLMARMIGAIVAAFVGTMIFFAFLRRVTLRSSVIVPIVGIMLGAIVGAVSTFVGLATNTLQSLGIWFMGSFTTVLKGQYEPLYVVTVVVVLVFLAADRFTVAGLGEDIATNVGLNYRQVVFAGTLLVAVATGVVTVVVGNLPFLGLIVPNVVSLIIGDNLRTKLPWTCLLGVALVTVCDILARVLIMPFEIPVATILSMVGAVVFIALLLRQRRHA